MKDDEIDEEVRKEDLELWKINWKKENKLIKNYIKIKMRK